MIGRISQITFPSRTRTRTPQRSLRLMTANTKPSDASSQPFHQWRVTRIIRPPSTSPRFIRCLATERLYAAAPTRIDPGRASSRRGGAGGLDPRGSAEAISTRLHAPTAGRPPLRVGRAREEKKGLLRRGFVCGRPSLAFSPRGAGRPRRGSGRRSIGAAVGAVDRAHPRADRPDGSRVDRPAARRGASAGRRREGKGGFAETHRHNIHGVRGCTRHAKWRPRAVGPRARRAPMVGPERVVAEAGRPRG